MTWRDVPVIPTIVVLAAVAVMIALGVWQLGRADEKEALVARYAAAQESNEILAIHRASDGRVYRRVRFDCQPFDGLVSVAGRNRAGQTGYVHRVECDTSIQSDGSQVFDDFYEGGRIYAEIGWSRGPVELQFAGGTIVGRLAAIGDDYKIVSEDGLAGLEPSAQPDPNDIPNNHLAYAAQWFLFALTALLTCLYPVDPYYESVLGHWDRGPWRNFTGLLEAATLLWPFVAASWCALRLAALGGESPSIIPGR